jgi:hypothetical protein
VPETPRVFGTESEPIAPAVVFKSYKNCRPVQNRAAKADIESTPARDDQVVTDERQQRQQREQREQREQHHPQRGSLPPGVTASLRNDSRLTK